MTWQEADACAQRAVIERARIRAHEELCRYQEHLRHLERCLAYAERRDAASSEAAHAREVMGKCQDHVYACGRELARVRALHVTPSPEGAFAPQVDFWSAWGLVSLQDRPLRSWSRDEYASCSHASLVALIRTVGADLLPELCKKANETERGMTPREDEYYMMLAWQEANTYQGPGGYVYPDPEKEIQYRQSVRSTIANRMEQLEAELRAAAPYDVVMPALLQRMARG